MRVHPIIAGALIWLAALLWMLSGYPSELYDTALDDWRRVERKALADGASERTEVLWINQRCAKLLDGEKMPLFASEAA